MGIKPEHLREIITHILKEADLHSLNAVELLMLTAAQESKLGYYWRQLGQGPARGIFQMEPATEKSLWQNYLKYRPDKTAIIARYDTADEDDLWWNLGYQIIIARMKYLPVPEALPNHFDVEGMAEYWKKYWNTYEGKGTVQEAILNYFEYCK